MHLVLHGIGRGLVLYTGIDTKLKSVTNRSIDCALECDWYAKYD